MRIPYIWYHSSNGIRHEEWYPHSRELSDEAMVFVNQGGRFEVEIIDGLYTAGELSMSAVLKDHEICLEICHNNHDSVLDAFTKIVHGASKYMEKNHV